MKISLQWLNEYIDIHDHLTKPQELANLLTAGGIEVESVQNLAKRFEHVVVGHILRKEPHPNADRLTLCQVSTGEGVVHQIVCGARNHNEGDNVVVALPGAVLPGDFAIRHSKIRGLDSSGMLCSEKELGLKSEKGSEDGSAGILILPKDAPVGQPFAKYMGLDDILFELKVTPNRADCLSHFGLAREIAAILGREVKFPIESLNEEGSTRDQMGLELRATDMCPRYAGRIVAGVKVGPSPDWLRKRLEAVGMNPINNVVDVTNFVMMELGQPLHAFDVREIKGHRIVVDRAVKGETFVTLDGTELKLDGTELTIRDSERPVALAGIVGGKNSGIQDDTTEIFIESAYFTPATVRRTARKFGIETDSSYRFARGTNPEAVPLAMNRAAQLIQKVAGGRVLGAHHDQYPHPVRHQAIEIGLSTLEDRLGHAVQADEFVDWMKRLGCEVGEVKRTGETAGRGPVWSVLPPSYRWDLSLDMDLVEEYARLHGYQHIPETLPPLAAMPATHDLPFVLESKIRRLLQGQGCLQAINYAFISRAFQERILGAAAGVASGETSDMRSDMSATGLRVSAQGPVALVNPLNEEINVMRAALVPGLVKNVVHNSRHGNAFGRLFELGFAHFGPGSREGATDYEQEARLGFAFWGGAGGVSGGIAGGGGGVSGGDGGSGSLLWKKGAGIPLIFTLKGAIENMLRGLGIQKWRWVQSRAGQEWPEFLHPGQAAILEFEGKAVGFMGTLHPVLADELKIREECALAEFNLDRLLAGQPRSPRYQPISKFPAVDRDIAFLMSKDLPASHVEAEIRKVSGDLLKEIRVFDVFEGGSLAVGQRSVAFRLIFQSQDTTLEDQAVNELRDKVVNAVSQKFAISIR